MSSKALRVAMLAGVVLLLNTVAFTRQGPARGPIESARDPEKEVFAKHNLEVARYYIIRRKAYDGALDRLKEIVDAYPEFSRMDEVVYWMAEANLKIDKEEASVELFEKLLKDYPGSEFAKKAKAELAAIKGTEKRKP